MKEAPNNLNIDARYRTMLALWFGQIGSVVMFFLFTQFAADSSEPPGPGENNSLSFVLAGVGAFLAVISFVVRSKLLQRSVERQDPSLVQNRSVAGCVLCEVVALLGVWNALSFRPRLSRVVGDRFREHGPTFSPSRKFACSVL